MNYLQRLREIEKREAINLQNLQNPEKGGFDGFEGKSPGAFENSPIDDLPLMPDDRKHIVRCLRFVPADREAEILAEYSRRWLAAADAEPVLHKKKNRGRFSANTYLLEVTA